MLTSPTSPSIPGHTRDGSGHDWQWSIPCASPVALHMRHNFQSGCPLSLTPAGRTTLMTIRPHVSCARTTTRWTSMRECKLRFEKPTSRPDALAFDAITNYADASGVLARDSPPVFETLRGSRTVSRCCWVTSRTQKELVGTSLVNPKRTDVSQFLEGGRTVSRARTHELEPGIRSTNVLPPLASSVSTRAAHRLPHY